MASRLLVSAVIVWSHPTGDRQNPYRCTGEFYRSATTGSSHFGMKLVSKIAVVAAGIVTAIWTISYWDAREADVACDIGQAPSHVCQGGFVKASRFKHLLETNERN